MFRTIPVLSCIAVASLVACTASEEPPTQDSDTDSDTDIVDTDTDIVDTDIVDTDTDTDTPMPDFGCPPTPPSAEILYESHFEPVLDSQMHYYEAGDPDGPVVLLLHGLPVSAYFWRNVIPHLEADAHVIALDHIGHGQSGRPEGLTYGLEDQVAYLDAFITAKGLDDITVVGQDLGSWTGMTWASRNPEKVGAVALVEGIIPPLLPASTATTDPNLLGIWQAARDPATAQQMFVEDHFFLETVLPQFTACGPTPEALAVYAEPWTDPESRHILYATPAEIPIDGVPAEHVPSIDAYIDWIETTDVPKLFVHATPSALMTADVIAGAEASMTNLTTVNIGGGIHFLAESKPDAVGTALSDWLQSDVLP